MKNIIRLNLGSISNKEPTRAAPSSGLMLIERFQDTNLRTIQYTTIYTQYDINLSIMLSNFKDML